MRSLHVVHLQGNVDSECERDTSCISASKNVHNSMYTVCAYRVYSVHVLVVEGELLCQTGVFIMVSWDNNNFREVINPFTVITLSFVNMDSYQRPVARSTSKQIPPTSSGR